MNMNDEIVASSFAVAQLMFDPSNVHIDLRMADLRTTLATVRAIVQRNQMTPTQVVEYLIEHGSRFDREVCISWSSSLRSRNVQPSFGQSTLMDGCSSLVTHYDSHAPSPSRRRGFLPSTHYSTKSTNEFRSNKGDKCQLRVVPR